MKDDIAETLAKARNERLRPLTLGTSLGLLLGDAEGSEDETIVGIKPVQPTVSVQPLRRPFRQAILVSCVEQILRLLIFNVLLHY